MPSVFISYSQDKGDPTHADRVARLAASLMQDSLTVFFDQNRGDEEEKLAWEIWMENQIEKADYVLVVCTELYLKKVRQEVPPDEGQGVCWEAGIMYSLLCEEKRNTTKFLPVMFLPAHKQFIPRPLKGKQFFVVDSRSGYDELYAFLTRQHRARFPDQGVALRTIAQRTIERLFALPEQDVKLGETDVAPQPGRPLPARNPQLTLKPDILPAPRQDIRGLDWYDECDAGHFIGRNKDAGNILSMLLFDPIIRLIGPSGVGKSSFIRAGLLPKIRESGWRACVIRPFEDPAQCIPLELTAKLITRSGTFTTPLDPAKFRADITPLLSSNGINRLVLFLDQFEDIVSPVADPGAVDAVREFLWELWEKKETKPYLRAVVVYRTDADARLGRLWQEVSGRPEGLPYLALQGVRHSVAKDIIERTAWEQGWRLETSVPEIVRQLAFESQKLESGSDEVFPVYLQMFLKQADAEQSTEGRITAEFITSLGGVSGLIGRYLEQTLGRLKDRGRDGQQCGAVLESLSRSTGAKATQSFDDLVRETGVSRPVLAEMLRELINERLVRPVGRDIYEIQHDRLAAAVVESMKDSDRESKAAREFLAAKVPAFERTMLSLAPGELVYLYRHRRKIHPTERELGFLLASMLHNIEEGARNESPAAYWFRESSPQDFLRWFIQIELWAAKESPSLRTSHEWVKTFPICGLEYQFSALAGNKGLPSIRAICAQWIGRAERDDDLPLLRRLVKDEDLAVRRVALEALGKFSKEGILPLLCELVRDEDSAVRRAALEPLERLSTEEDLPLLRDLLKDPDLEVRLRALKALARFSREEALPLLRELAEDQYRDMERTALKALANFSKEEAGLPLLRQMVLNDRESGARRAAAEALAGFSKEEALPLLRKLAGDQNWSVRAAAMKVLASFSKEEDLELLRKLAKDQSWGNDQSWEAWAKNALRYSVIKGQYRDVGLVALANFSKEEDLPVLRELAKDRDSAVRLAAVKALGRFSKEEDLPVLRELANDRDSAVRLAVVEALGRFSKEEDLPVLRELAKDQYRGVRLVAMEVVASFSKEEDLPSLRELVKDRDSGVRLAGLKALASFSKEEDLPQLRQLLKDRDWNVRLTALKALASFSKEEDLRSLRELAKDPDWDMRLAVVEALAIFSKEGGLPLLRELIKDINWDVRAASLKVLASFSTEEALPLLRELVMDPSCDVRAAAVETLENFAKEEDALPLLRELAKDPDSGVRAAAMRALAGFSTKDVLPLLCELANDFDLGVRAAATKALASFSKEEALLPLRKLALVADDKVSAEAVRDLASVCSHAELEAFLNGNEQEFCAAALAALDDLLYMPAWLQAKRTGAAT